MSDDTTTDDLIAFVNARLDDKDQPARWVEAARRILKEHNPYAWSNTNQNRYCPSCAEDTYDPARPYERVIAPCLTLRLLVSVYDDDPGYQERWRP